MTDLWEVIRKRVPPEDKREDVTHLLAFLYFVEALCEVQRELNTGRVSEEMTNNLRNEYKDVFRETSERQEDRKRQRELVLSLLFRKYEHTAKCIAQDAGITVEELEKLCKE